jgi:hypothetical protein
MKLVDIDEKELIRNFNFYEDKKFNWFLINFKINHK